MFLLERWPHSAGQAWPSKIVGSGARHDSRQLLHSTNSPSGDERADNIHALELVEETREFSHEIGHTSNIIRVPGFPHAGGIAVRLGCWRHHGQKVFVKIVPRSVSASR